MFRVTFGMVEQRVGSCSATKSREPAVANTSSARKRACSVGCKSTLLQLFGLLQLQSIERKILYKPQPQPDCSRSKPQRTS
jgi:hypothetical protein